MSSTELLIETNIRPSMNVVLHEVSVLRVGILCIRIFWIYQIKM